MKNLKEQVKQSLFTDKMMIYPEHLRTIKKSPEIIMSLAESQITKFNIKINYKSTY